MNTELHIQSTYQRLTDIRESGGYTPATDAVAPRNGEWCWWAKAWWYFPPGSFQEAAVYYIDTHREVLTALEQYDRWQEGLTRG